MYCIIIYKKNLKLSAQIYEFILIYQIETPKRKKRNKDKKFLSLEILRINYLVKNLSQWDIGRFLPVPVTNAAAVQKIL